jgi:hypothetical protein
MRRTIVLLAVAMLLLVLPSAAIASGSVPVTIEVPTDFSQTEWPFTAHGEAVDIGLICSSGTVTDGKYIAAGRPDGGHWNFRIEKVFVCKDGSGSFTINLQAHVYFEPYSDVGTWNVLRGDGEYSHMHGNGDLVGTQFEGGGGVLDIYTGSIQE